MHASLGIVAFLCALNNWAVEADESEVQGQPWLLSKFKATMSHKRSCLKKKEAGMALYPLIPALERQR